jgi:hypothetical protein
MTRFTEIKFTEHKICVLIFSTFFVRNISHSKKNWARCHKYVALLVKCPLFLSEFTHTWTSLTDFRKIFRYKLPWISIQQNPIISMRTDRRSDMTKTVASRNYADATKNRCLCFLGAFLFVGGGVFQLSSSSSSSVGPGGKCPRMYLSQCGLLYLPCFWRSNFHRQSSLASTSHERSW